MKRLTATILAAGSVALSGAALSQSGEDLARSRGCLNCHAVSQKKVGPSLKEIAAANRGNPAAESRLIAFLMRGKGHAKVPASEEELKALVQYVLKQ